MKNDQLISICIPTFNNAQYIGQTIESLLEQSYSNIEIIVSDNSSTDDTKGVVLGLAKKDSRIRYSRNRTNIGYVGNVKKVVSLAKSDVLAIYHSDDVYCRSIVERQYAALKSYRATAVFAMLREFRGDIAESKGTSQSAEIRQRVNGEDLVGGLAFYTPYLLWYGNIFTCPSLMIRKEDYLGFGGYTDAYPSNEDLDFWLRILNGGGSLCLIADELFFYRRSATQGSAYFLDKLEYPVMFRVLDELLVKPLLEDSYRTRIFHRQLTRYRRNKARALAQTARRVLVTDRENGLKLYSLSTESYQFPLFSLYGIFQRFPSIHRMLALGRDKLISWKSRWRAK